MIKKIHVKRGDKVVVISGKDKGKKGKVLSVNPKTAKVIVEGVNVATKHSKPRRQGDVGGIIKQETPIYAAKVMYFCEKCNNKTRVGRMTLEGGKNVRYCKKCKEVIDD